MHKNIKTVAGCFTNVTCNVTATDGREVELTAYIAIGQERRPVPKAGAKLFAFPAVEYGQHLYEIRADGKPLIFGFLLVRPSAFPVAQGTVDYTLNATLSSVDALHVDIELTPGPRGYSAYEVAVMEGFVGSEAEWLEHMRQQTATLAVEQVTPLMQRAETAAGDAEQSAADADAHKAAAQAAQRSAEDEAARATEAANKAAQHEDTVRGLITDAAAHEQAAAKSAQDALANQQGAEQAAQDAAQAQVAAQTAKTDAEAAKTEAQTAESNAKASADAAAADKAAAAQAKQDAQAAQSTAEEQADIAKKAAADAQSPESIAAQAARPATMLLVRDELMSILGDSSLFDLDTDGQKIIVHTDRLGEEQLAAVTDMLERFVPQFIEVVRCNHNMEISWRDMPCPFPIDRINKYDDCVNRADILAINADYVNDVYETELSDKTFAYSFSNLANYGNNFLHTSSARAAWLYMPKITVIQSFAEFSSFDYFYIYAPKATSANFLLYSSTCPRIEGNLDGMIYATGIHTSSIRQWRIPLPSLSDGRELVKGCQVDKESVLIICNSIPAYTSGSHPLKLGIHIDHKYDPDVNFALKKADINYESTVDLPEEVTEGKGWTLTVQWNGTPTSTASTMAMGSLIYAKVGEIERPDGTTERVLDWGHYVTNWEERGYEQFRSLESAYRYFNLPEPDEPLTNE